MRPNLPAMLAAVIAVNATALVAQDYPQTFEHRYGTTVITEPPERIVSLSYQNHDNFLALGVVPVGIRHWYGDYPDAVWPWAQAALGEARPFVIRGDISIEAIAALEPDVIEAVWSGITAEEYEILSGIAPVVAAEAQYGEYGTPWDVIIQTVGRIAGREDAANAQLDALRGRMDAIAADHPGWAGQTVAIASFWQGAVGVSGPDDIRMTLIGQLGLTATPEIAALVPPGVFSIDLSPEDLGPIDADVLIWFADSGVADSIRDLTLRPTTRAHGQGREIVSDDLMTGAFSHASLLSIPYVLDRLVPEIELAIDGDPATPVPSAVAAGFAP